VAKKESIWKAGSKIRSMGPHICISAVGETKPEAESRKLKTESQKPKVETRTHLKCRRQTQSGANELKYLAWSVEHRALSISQIRRSICIFALVRVSRIRIFRCISIRAPYTVLHREKKSCLIRNLMGIKLKLGFKNKTNSQTT